MKNNLLNSIRNNILSVSFSQIISLLFNIVTFGIAARALGVENFGYFNFLLATVGIFSKLIDFGTNPIVFRETAKNEYFSEIIIPVLTFKILIFIVFVIIITLVLSFYQFNTREILIINFMLFNILLSNKYTTFRELLVIPYKVKLRMITPALIVLFDNIVLLILTLFLPNFEDKLLAFSFIYLISNLPGITLLIILLKKYFRPKLFINIHLIKSILVKSLPLWGYVLLTIIFMQSDTILLNHLQNKFDVGIYSAALRLSMPMIIIPSAITMSIFPLLVKQIENGQNYSDLVNSVIKVLIIISTLLFFVVYFNSELLITIIFGKEFLLAKEPLLFLLLSIILIFPTYFILDFFTAINLQKLNFILAGLQIIIAIPLYYILILHFSYNGAAIAKLLAFISGSIFLFIKLKSKNKIKLNIIRIFLWITSSLLFSFFLYKYSNQYLNLIFLPFFITLLLFLIKVFNPDEIVIIKRLFNRNVSKI